MKTTAGFLELEMLIFASAEPGAKVLESGDHRSSMNSDNGDSLDVPASGFRGSSRAFCNNVGSG
jgi:hypothetical protein